MYHYREKYKKHAYSFIVHCATSLKGPWERKGNKMECAAHDGISGHKTLLTFNYDQSDN